jgi:hypothetical protein
MERKAEQQPNDEPKSEPDGEPKHEPNDAQERANRTTSVKGEPNDVVERAIVWPSQLQSRRLLSSLSFRRLVRVFYSVFLLRRLVRSSVRP